MRKKAAICYFSGTGNTEIIAGFLKKEFINHQYIVEIFKIEDILNKNIEIDMSQYEFLEIGSPVSGFGVPKIVLDFIKKLPEIKSEKVFIFKTAGGVAPINFNSSASMIKKLKRKGYEIIYDQLFSIGSNWIVKFDNNVSKELYKASMHKAELMCNEILSSKTRLLKPKILIKIITSLIQIIKNPCFRFIVKDYKVTNDCNSCGICIKGCPAKNVKQKNGKIKFGIKCLWCMRCIYSCPQNVIKQRLLSFCIVPDGYDPDKIINNPEIKNSTKGFIPPFFKNYVENENM